MTPHLETIEPAELTSVTDIGSAFCSAKLLLSALELGVFTALHDAPAGEPELRERLELHSRAARDFLDALVALGLLRRTGELYRNSEIADRQLVRGPGYGGGFLEGANHVLYPAWGKLSAALRTGEPQAEGDLAEMLADPVRQRGYLAMMDSLSDPLAGDLARSLDWSRYRTLADIGGGRGNMVGRLLQQHDHLHGVVFDLPANAAPCAEHTRALGVTERVRFCGGDFFADALPEADVLIIGHVLADFSTPARQTLVDKAFRAVQPGGAVIVYDPMPDEQYPDLPSLLASLHMLLMTPAGSGYPPGQCREWMRQAGFLHISGHLSELGNSVMIGHKAG
ncbi:MAG: methyltransferase [Pseudonocardiaceae bacterium]